MFLPCSVMLPSKISLHTAAITIVQKYHGFHDTTIFDSLPRLATADPKDSILTLLGWLPCFITVLLSTQLCPQLLIASQHLASNFSPLLHLYQCLHTTSTPQTSPPLPGPKSERNWCQNPTLKVPMLLSASSLLRPHFYQGLGLPFTVSLLAYQSSLGFTCYRSQTGPSFPRMLLLT